MQKLAQKEEQKSKWLLHADFQFSCKKRHSTVNSAYHANDSKTSRNWQFVKVKKYSPTSLA